VRSGAVDVASVVDIEEDDAVAILIEPIPHSILASAGPPHALERGLQRRVLDVEP